MPTTDTRTRSETDTKIRVPDEAAPTSRAPTRVHLQRRTPSTAVLAAIVAVVLVAVAAITWTLAGPTADEVTDTTTTTSTGLTEDEALRRLIARGYVPIAAIPPSLYTREELATIRLVRTGVLPAEVLETDPFVTKELINRGLVPPGSAR